MLQSDSISLSQTIKDTARHCQTQSGRVRHNEVEVCQEIADLTEVDYDVPPPKVLRKSHRNELPAFLTGNRVLESSDTEENDHGQIFSTSNAIETTSTACLLYTSPSPRD